MTFDRHTADEEPVVALLATLAEHSLAEAPINEAGDLDGLAARALDQLGFRHAKDGADRGRGFGALSAGRRITMGEQHRRRLEPIGNRINSSKLRGLAENSIDLLRTQLRHAQEGHDRRIAESENLPAPEVELQPLVAWVLRVVLRDEAA